MKSMKNIILTGLMGSGKTTVGNILKEIFRDFSFVETDSLIIKKEGLSINDIFSIKGENYFRKIEKTVIEDVLKEKNQIISLGGGSLENDFDFETAKKTSVIFYLKADVEILFERIKNNKERPLLNCENPKNKLKELLDKRKNNYEKADFIIDVSKISAKEAAQEIERVYRNETENY